MTPALRDPLASYQPLGPLRLDGVGTLECARSLSTGQRVCLRRVPSSAQAQQVVELALSLPRHDALAAALDSGVWEDFVWLVTDFPEGKLLGDEAGSAVGAHALAMDFAPIAEALQVLHESGRAHGLISGDALLAVDGGRLVLHEAPLLELNRATDRRPEQTALAQLQRAAPFFAPERLKGGAPTAAGDVYGLGVLIALRAGANRPPGQSALERVHALMNGSWRPVAPTTVPAAFAQLIDRMTHADPALRPTASEAGALLQELCRVEEVAIPAPVPTAPGAPHFVRPEPPRRSPPILVPALPPSLAALSRPVPTAPNVEASRVPSFPAPAVTAPSGDHPPSAQPVLAPFVGPEPVVITQEAPPPISEVAVAVVAPPAAIPAPQPTAPYGAMPINFTAPATQEFKFAAAPTVEMPARAVLPPAPTVPNTGPSTWMLQSGGAQPLDLSLGKSLPPRPQPQIERGALASLRQWASSFTISIAASDAKLITTSLIAMVMLASTVALGAHVINLRSEARELAAAEAIKPRALKEPKYNSEQLKQILRQKEAAHHEY